MEVSMQNVRTALYQRILIENSSKINNPDLADPLTYKGNAQVVIYCEYLEKKALQSVGNIVE